MALAVLMAGAVETAAAADAVLYRIFLRDGNTLVSYGDFARVGDRVVFSMPLDGNLDSPQLQLVTITESTVDWEKTDRYAYAARAQHYAQTRGEDDFTLLSADVARALNEAALTSDPKRRVAFAEQARKQLAEWPTKNYGYRANDVAQLSMLLDEVVSELRVAAGMSRFDLALTSGVAVPPPVPLLPPPSLRESIELAFTASRVTPEPTERVAVLRAITTSLERPAAEGGWAAALHARATADLAIELKADREYAELSAKTLKDADRRARRADVRGLEKLMRETLEKDAELGRLRPGAVAALMSTLDVRLSAARRLRLARDAWALRSDALRAYRRQAKKPLDRLNGVKRWLEDVRALAGPSPRSLQRLEERATTAMRELARIKPPAELEAAHGKLSSAARMASHAAATRRVAIKSGDLKTAWDASSAAAGALMLIDGALADLKTLSEPPQLQ